MNTCPPLLGIGTAVPSMYWVLRIAGGSYLRIPGRADLAGRRRADLDQAAEPVSSARAWRSFASGLATQMSNPEAVIVYSSVLAAFLPASPSMAFNLSVAAMVFGIEAGWYVFVALAQSASGPRGIYLRYKSWIDRVAGGVMVALGLRLVSATGRP